MSEWGECPHCGLNHRVRQDNVCPRCQQDVSLAPADAGMYAPPREVASPRMVGPSSTGQGFLGQLVAGLIGGVVGGAVWAGVVVLTGYEVGWVAMGIGLLVGIAVRVTAGEGSATAPFSAAGAAAVGLLIGKLLIVQWGGASMVAKEMSDDSQLMATAVAVKMLVEDELDPGLAAELASAGPDVMASIDLELRMESVQDEAVQRLSEMTEPQKMEVAQWFGEYAVSKLTYTERIEAMLSPWDILWFLLALGTAAKVAAGDYDDESME